MSNQINLATKPQFVQHSPWVLLLVTLGVTMVGFQFIGAFVGIVVAFPFFNGYFEQFLEALLNSSTLPSLSENFEQFFKALLNPTANAAIRTPMLIMQGVGSLMGFIVLPWLLMKYFYREGINIFSGRKIEPMAIVITLLITIFFMGVNAPFIEWNQNFIFPDALSDLEVWLRTMEDTLAETSAFITHFDSMGQLVLGLIVVAVIPGIGEEFVFRGLIQNHILRLSGNIHVAIWFGALLFSLFHMQFYGLLPRMMLGALFGYLYYYSGNIIYSMVAHFFNNAFTLIMLYLFQQNIVDFDIDGTEVLPWPQVIFSAGVTLILFMIFMRNTKPKPANE